MNNPNVITPYGRQTVTWGNQFYDNPTLLDSSNGTNRVAYGNNTYSIPQSLGEIGIDAYRNGSVGNMDGVTVSTGTSDQPTVTQTFSPEQQDLYNKQTGISQRLAQLGLNGLDWLNKTVDTPLDVSGMSPIRTGPRELDLSGVSAMPTANEETRKAVASAILSRQQPAMDQARQGLEGKLISRGFRPGTEAWNREMLRIGQQENDARIAADIAGGQEMQRIFGMGLQSRQQGVQEAQAKGQFGLAADQFNNQARGQQIQEALLLRQLPLTELNALRTGAMPNLPQFANYQGQGVQAAPMFNAANAAADYSSDVFNAQSAQQGNLMNGLFGLGAAGIYGLTRK